MSKKKILIVDDEEAFADIVKLNLEHTGRYDVAIEVHGTQALSAARRFRPDLIILDMIMPDMDGEEVYRRLTEDGEFHDIPVVFLSAYIPSREKELLQKNDSQPLMLTKPISSEDLIRAVDARLR